MWIWKNFIKFWEEMINGHGDDLYKYGNIVANFSSNVYNEVDHSLLWAHLRNRMECMVSYPEPQPFTLEKELAAVNGIETEDVCVTNGATEAIYLIAQKFAGSRSVIFVPAFSEYGDACKIHNHKITGATSQEEIESLCRAGGVDMVWICNPNNPTGIVQPKGELAALVERYPGVVFVVDQSYEFFTLKEVFTAAEGVSYRNLILLHSMTKRYAVPGVRLGYMTACEEMLDKIKNIRMPWSVNAFAIESGLFLLKNDISKSTDISVLLERSRTLAQRLEALGDPGEPFFKVEASDTHYMLVEIVKGMKYPVAGGPDGEAQVSDSAAILKEYLATEYGILIRDASNFATLGKGYFRIATQTDTQNKLLIEALEKLCI